MPVNHAYRALPIGLFELSPGQETSPRSRFQHAQRLSHRKHRIAKEHYSKARSSQIKLLIPERQRVRIRLPGNKVFEAAIPGSLLGNLQQVRTQIERCDLTLCSY